MSDENRDSRWWLWYPHIRIKSIQTQAHGRTGGYAHPVAYYEAVQSPRFQ